MTLEFAGDNPCVVLYDPVGAVVSAVSFWDADYSLAGTGRALFFLSTRNGHPEGRIFAEDKAPIDFFRGLNQHFLGFEAIPWASIEPEAARLEAGWHGDAYAVTCTHRDGTIDVGWRDFDAPTPLKQRSTDFGGEAGRSYDIASVIIGASGGVIRVDGTTLPGTITSPYGALPKSSFLAFCETWLRL